MADIVTYTGQGYSSVNGLIHSIINDLTGGGTPVTGVAATHMAHVFPDPMPDYTAAYNPTDDATSKVVILESTTEVDPFARADIAVEDVSKDPWRICFQTYKWRRYKTWQVGKLNNGAVEDNEWVDEDTSTVHSLGI